MTNIFSHLFPGKIIQTTTSGAILWSYSRNTGWVKETSTGDTVLDAWNGGYTSDTTEGVGYYIGGQVNTWSSPGTVIAYQRLLLSLRGNKWTKENLPDRLAYIQHPFLEYLPLGKKGILVNIGGLKMDGEKVKDAGAELV